MEISMFHAEQSWSQFFPLCFNSFVVAIHLQRILNLVEEKNH